jgi:hypothetical protein
MSDAAFRDWLLEQRADAFRRFYTSEKLDDYDKGLRWGILATLDNILAQMGDRPIVNGSKDLWPRRQDVVG